MSRKRKALTIISLLVGLAILVACAAPTPEVVEKEVVVEKPVVETVVVEKEVVVTATPQPAPKPGEIQEITVLAADRELSKRNTQISIDKFNMRMAEEGKPYRAKIVVGPAGDDDLHTKILIDAAAGTLADVFSMLEQWQPDFIAAGYALDLTPYVNDWPGWQHFYPVLRDMVTVDGKVYAIPGAGGMDFFYRKDILEQYGISTEQPKTWEEMFARCEEIKQKTGKWAILIPAGASWGGGTFEEGFREVFPAFGDPLYNQETGKWVVKSPGLLKTFQVYETAVKNGYMPVDELLAPRPWTPTKYEMFPNGDLIIVTGGHWQWEFDWGPEGATPIEGLFEKVDRWLMPSEDGNPYFYASQGWGSMISAESKYPEAAFEYLKFTHSPEDYCNRIATYASVSPRDDVKDLCLAYKEAVNGKLVDSEVRLLNGRYFFHFAPGLDHIVDEVAQLTEEILLGNLTAEEAAERFAKDMTEKLGADKVEEMP